MIAPKGIDNVFFTVGDLSGGIAFYQRCGFRLKFSIDAAGLGQFAIGDEAPGLMLRRGEGAGAGRLWVEVDDAETAGIALAALGIGTHSLETATGVTVEATDPWGNVVGFADYSKRPELARKP